MEKETRKRELPEDQTSTEKDGVERKTAEVRSW